MALQALLFDVDGTLVDTEEVHRQAFNQAFVEFKLGWEWGPVLYAQLLTVSGGVDRMLRYVDRLGLPATESSRLRGLVPAIHREKTRIYGELLQGSGSRLRPGVARIVDEARRAGVRVGLAATSALPNVRALVTAAFSSQGLDAIGAIIAADLVMRKKPAPDLYELLLASLHVPAQDCVAFEDSANGVAAARAARMFTVVTPTRWTAGQDFSDADLMLSGLGEPDAPLPPAETARIGGAPYLGLAQVAALHAVAPRGRARLAPRC